MSDTIRNVRLEEADDFARFLERCFGHGFAFFGRCYPHFARADEEMAKCCLVVERDGKIISHVGTYPMEIVAGPARIFCGGIGGVATIPEGRGEGHMSRLLKASIERMREQGMTLSVLWGDRQRYGSFGWETCGLKYTLRLSRRSLGWSKIEPTEVREVEPAGPEALEAVARLHPTLAFRVARPRLALMLTRIGIRIFVGPDGYAITRGETAGSPDVEEVVSPTGREAEIIRAVLDIVCGGAASVDLGPCEGERTERLVAVMSSWDACDQGMFRIIDWPGLLRALAPLLAERAARAELEPFRRVYSCRWGDAIDHAAVEWDGSAFNAEATATGGDCVTDARLLAGMLLGGPHLGRARLGPLGRLLPVPLHIPSMDHV